MVDVAECSAAPVPVPEDEVEPAHPDPSSIPPDAWRRFESAALGVVNKIQPTVASENFRSAVIDYLKRLLGSRAGVQVFPFGSVPLKTYLPDGDIDLTAFSPAISDENLANQVYAILSSEQHRKDSEFDVKDVQYIHAENIVVDISVNQIGGLSTLCFLEKVDENFGKKHLLKRSIVLIKDWCYYESRILGAQNGLLSTYALEVLVLYVFLIFHRSLGGPLAVLYRFLDFYSKFDWDSKGISLFGPVSLSSLPNLVTDPHLPAIDDDFFVPREKILRKYAEDFSAPPRNSERDAQVFSRKFLNIVDPLKQSNNLGRSVNKGNFYRIRSAFDFGARKLGKILQMPVCYTVNEVNQFFSNTLKRNHTGFRPDDGSSPLYSNPYGDLSYQFNNILNDLTGDFEINFRNLQYAQGFQQVNPANSFYYGRLAPPPLQYQNTHPSDSQGRKNPHAYASMNGAIPCPPYPSGCLAWRPFIQPDDPMAMRARGIGTYFPDPRLCKDRPPAGRGEREKNQFT
ncbi:uncharacterized protein LOC8067188 isoform X2 [Sorghum bicolor]|uniref:uncharacterized protein LOC8067188 isoform X2 n=1 Tax=Sorghum bicolor TaxID=4558 RepID=UPI000B423A75|nr:uncharacterized protein LOC8067188 isoform X2 [Sorghum bicolor]|eukprot:XP_021301416.1 uncharacterized protein LOC8067188 isoform X2 [Sorghum bicolor]